MLIYDDIYIWDGWGGALRLGSGRCRLRIYDLRKGSNNELTHLRPVIVVVSDVPESEMTVKSCASHIATRVIKDFNIERQRMLFVEYYPATRYGEKGEHVIPERFDAVDLVWHGDKAVHPKWRALTPPLLDIVRRFAT